MNANKSGTMNTTMSKMSIGGDSQLSETMAGAKLVSDARRRVTVAMPKNLSEVEQHAHRHFKGHKGVYHNGTHKIHKDHHVDRLKDGDIVVVRAATPDHVDWLTTHQANYIQHPLEAPRMGAPRGLPQSMGKFMGQSTHKADFVEHPIDVRKPLPNQGSNWNRNMAPTGTSTYRQEFIPHDATKPKQIKPKQQNYFNGNVPFDAITSYQGDYIKHPLRPATSVERSQREYVPVPFDGSTTYGHAYVEHPLDPSKPFKPDKSSLADNNRPFDGMTEYGREFLKHNMANSRLPVIHLEPSIESRRNASAPALKRPASTPAGNRH